MSLLVTVARARRLALPSIAALALLGATACVDISGGAAELSWSLFDLSGDSVSCGDAAVADVRLCWDLLEGGAPSTECAASDRATFRCADEHGATSFALTPGPTAFWVEPVCGDGEAPVAETFEVPALIVRDVADGRVVNLSSLAIVVAYDEDSDRCPDAGCICR